VRLSAPNLETLMAELKLQSGADELGFVDLQNPSVQEQYRQDMLFYQKWLEEGLAAQQPYLKSHLPLKEDPQQLFSDLGLIFVFLFNYYQEPVNPGISIYAYGRDYHRVIKGKIKTALKCLMEVAPESTHRTFVDSAPVAERTLARLANLGFIGKNRCLISPKKGSYFFIASVFTDLQMDYQGENATPLRNLFELCGNCTRCLDACPTQALDLQNGLDSNKCISYWTIESPESTPDSLKSLFNDKFFGCDICQEVCPWNRFKTDTPLADFLTHNPLVEWTSKHWREATPEQFDLLSRGSVLRRAGLEKIQEHATPGLRDT